MGTLCTTVSERYMSTLRHTHTEKHTDRYRHTDTKRNTYIQTERDTDRCCLSKVHSLPDANGSMLNMYNQPSSHATSSTGCL